MIGEKAWDRLTDRLAVCHLHPHPPLRAQQTIMGWVGQLGPCFDADNVSATYDRIVAVAAGLAFEEVPTLDVVRGTWQDAQHRWIAIQAQMQMQGAAPASSKSS